jgi:hypothetical protein
MNFKRRGGAQGCLPGVCGCGNATPLLGSVGEVPERQPGKGTQLPAAKVKPGDRVRLKVAIDGNAAVASAHDDVCLSTRMYDRGNKSFGIWSDTAGAGFTSVTLCVRQTSEQEGHQ